MIDGREVAAVAEAARGAAAAAGSADGALRPEDFIHARLRVHQQRVERALAVIRRAAEQGPVGVSFSGGKDSTVALDLVHRVVPDAPAAFFDSGDELLDTYAVVAHYGVETIHPRLTMREMARYSGWWGYRDPVDAGCPFQAKQILIVEPAEVFVVRQRLRVVVMGLRAEESSGRTAHLRRRGALYRGADRTWYCAPLAAWSLSDVWAYLATRGLRYHVAYDAMARTRIPREAQRVAGLLGERGSGWGRHELLRRYAPATWESLVAEFPGLRQL